MSPFLALVAWARKISRQQWWSVFVAGVLLVCTVGPTLEDFFLTGSLTRASLVRLVALASGLRLWFSLIPGSRAIPCPSCGQIIGEFGSGVRGTSVPAEEDELVMGPVPEPKIYVDSRGRRFPSLVPDGLGPITPSDEKSDSLGPSSPASTPDRRTLSSGDGTRSSSPAGTPDRRTL